MLETLTSVPTLLIFDAAETCTQAAGCFATLPYHLALKTRSENFIFTEGASPRLQVWKSMQTEKLSPGNWQVVSDSINIMALLYDT